MFWQPNCFKEGMTAQKKTFLLSQLQDAIDEAISESGRIGDVIDEMKRCGFDLSLILESTVTISPAEDHQRDAVPEPRLISNVAQSIGQIELTDHDLDFLKELKIAA